ncbi:MAG: low molecular weight phosphotyrosine protein phosphatase [Alphaproteobacteria bacterium]|nr:low molecular weight phosphotyrosine protein phosphatase [Alphaproteobacteria bacterium]
MAMKILFVCTGNICRSPTAHGVFRDKVAALGLPYFCDSAGTHAYHVGEPPDIRTQYAAKARGYDLSGLRARKVTHDDFKDFDLILCMDAGHKLILERAAPKAYHHKIRMFDAVDVGDPYYGGEEGFERVLDQIEAACDRWIAATQS